KTAACSRFTLPTARKMTNKASQLPYVIPVQVFPKKIRRAFSMPFSRPIVSREQVWAYRSATHWLRATAAPSPLPVKSGRALNSRFDYWHEPMLYVACHTQIRQNQGFCVDCAL